MKSGRGSLVHIEGPAGVGKTSLLEVAGEMAASAGLETARVAGSPTGGKSEYEAVRSMLRPLVEELDPAEAEEIFAGPTSLARGILYPEEGATAPAIGMDPTESILRSVYWLVVRLAARSGGLIVIVDDVQWCDGSSVLGLAYLARRIESEPVALLAATRLGEPASTEGLTTVATESDAKILTPENLSATGIRDLLTETAGTTPEEPVVAAFEEATGGNPFLLRELVDSLAGQGMGETFQDPDRISRIGREVVPDRVAERVMELGPGRARVAQAIAVLGGEADVTTAAQVAETDPDQVWQSVDELADAGLVETGTRLKVKHPLITGALLESLGDEAAAWHRRAFEALASAGVPDGALLDHALRADSAGDQRLVGTLRRNARSAMATGNPQASVEYLRRAMEEPPSPESDPEVRSELGQCLIRAGDFGAGMDLLAEAGLGLSDPARLGVIQREVAFAAFATGGIDHARQIVADAIGGLGPEDRELSLQLTSDLATFAWLAGGSSGVELEEFSDLAGETAAERSLLALLSQERQAVGGRADEVVEVALRALGDGRLIAEDGSDALAWYMATYSLLTCEAFDESGITIDQALHDGQSRGSSFAIAGALGCRSVLMLNIGRPRDAEADAQTAANADLPPIMRPVNAGYLVRALVAQGLIDRAEEELNAGGIAEGSGGPTVLRWIPWARAELRAAQGRVDDVRLDIACLVEDEVTGRSMKALPWRALLATAIARTGYSSEAEALASDHYDWAESWGCPGARAVATHALALAGPEEEKTERLELAMMRAGESKRDLVRAQIAVDLGGQLIETQRDRAVELLRDALKLAGERGARRIAGDAGALLRTVGIEEEVTITVLTPAEKRVAELVSTGRSNREVAESLMVTRKTVENHLSRIYSKLGLASRSELGSMV